MKSIFKIFSFTKSFWKWYLFMSVFVLIVSLLNLVGPLLSKNIVDLIVAKVQGQDIEFSRFIILLTLIIASDILITLFTAFSQWIGDLLTVKLQTHLTTKYYHHVLSLHAAYYDNEITGRLVNKMYRGITSITEFIQNMFNNFLPFFLSAFVTILLLAHYSLFIAFLLAVLFPIYILISHGSTLAWGKYEGQKNQLNDLSQGRVFEALSAIRVVKSFASEYAELKSFLKVRNKIEDLAKNQTKEWHIYDFYRRLALNIILFAIYAYVVINTFTLKFTIGEMTLLIQLVNQARFPLFAMSFILGQIQEAAAGSKDFFEILAKENKIRDIPYAKTLHIPKKLKDNILINFDHVTFSYEKSRQIVKNITFVLKKGERLALVGESGQGKSTIVNLLLRYYEPQKGVIYIGGHDIVKVTQDSLHQNIAVVFQDSLLFSGTIRENIIYGCPDASKNDLLAASEAANAHDFISTMPDKYESIIGERGVKLSGGQKQRIAIARAILKNAPIIILDEATSSLDSKSELEVQRGLNHLLKDRTSIIIAHRLSTIANAHHILVLEEGSVSQYGTSKELLKDKKGLYYQLVTLQQRMAGAPDMENKAKLTKFDIYG